MVFLIYASDVLAIIEFMIFCALLILEFVPMGILLLLIERDRVKGQSR